MNAVAAIQKARSNWNMIARLKKMSKPKGRPKLSDAEKDARASRFRALRGRLGLGQDDVAKFSGGLLTRTEVVKVEGGENAVTGTKMVAGLAAGYGLTRAQVEALRDGDLAPDDAFIMSTRREVVVDEAVTGAIESQRPDMPTGKPPARTGARKKRAHR